MVYYKMTKDATTRVYSTPQEKKQFKKQAEKEGLDLSSWFRRLAKKEVTKEVTA